MGTLMYYGVCDATFLYDTRWAFASDRRIAGRPAIRTYRPLADIFVCETQRLHILVGPSRLIHREASRLARIDPLLLAKSDPGLKHDSARVHRQRRWRRREALESTVVDRPGVLGLQFAIN